MRPWLWLVAAGLICALPAPGVARMRLRRLSELDGRAEPLTGLLSASNGRLRPILPAAERFARLSRNDGVRRAAILGFALAVGVGAAAITGQILVGGAVAVGSALLCQSVFRRLVSLRASRNRRDLRAALSMLDAELSAGAREAAALAAAAGVAGSHAAVFARAAVEAGRGADMSILMADAGPGFAGLAAAWRVRVLCGVPLADIVARVELDLAADDALRREVDAALAGPRASGALLSVLPILGVALGSAMGAHPLPLLLGTTAGAALMLVGVLFDAVGLLWMRQLIRVGGLG